MRIVRRTGMQRKSSHLRIGNIQGTSDLIAGRIFPAAGNRIQNQKEETDA